MSMMRRPCWVGIIVARISQGRSSSTRAPSATSHGTTRRTLVLVLRRVRGAPNLVVPEVSIDLEHLVTGHVQRLLDAVGGFDERGRGVCRVVREAHEVLYQFRQQRDGEQQREEVNKDSCEKGEVGVLQERLYKRLAEARDQQEAKNHIPQPSARSRS